MASDSDCSDDENIFGNDIVPGFDYSDLDSASEDGEAVEGEIADDDSNDIDFNISEFNSIKIF